MEIPRLTLPPVAGAGDITTFYAFDSDHARRRALARMAHLLAGRRQATVPVLMIDWDLESPGLHHVAGARGVVLQPDRPGLVEYFDACREQLGVLRRSHVSEDADVLARMALASVDWEAYVERVDASRPLYLMRAGRFDDTYGERVARLDWDTLFRTCPALFRQFGAHLTRHFRHVLIDARSGRSAAVSVCTALLPGKLVALFTPERRSLDGLCGVVERAIAWRCTHEEHQRALLVYPLPCGVDSTDAERRQQWRRGTADQPGYQARIEALVRACYGLPRVSLDDYFDHVQLPHAHAMADGAQAERDADRFSLTRTLDTLLDWVAAGRFPWQAREELALRDAIGAARAESAAATVAAVATGSTLALARALDALAQHYLARDRPADAKSCAEESLALHLAVLGEQHARTRASRAVLAGVLLQLGFIAEAKSEYERLAGLCAAAQGEHHAESLAARAGLAAALAQLGHYPRALTVHQSIIEACERAHGADHTATLDALADQAVTLGRQGERARARMVYERVLEGRERLLGDEHDATLRCREQLAALLCDMGDLRHARNLQEQVLQARLRHAGPDHAGTIAARAALADMCAAQDDLHAVRDAFMSLTQARAGSDGADRTHTLHTGLRLAAALDGQGERTRPASPAPRALSASAHGNDGVAAPARARPPADALDAQIAHLEHLLAHGEPRQHAREARILADTLRKAILRPNVACTLRRRGVMLIKQVYLQDKDSEALLAFTQDELAAEGAAGEVAAASPLAFP